MIIVFDNNNSTTCTHSLWGFSAYFEEYKLLFDTGSNGRVLQVLPTHCTGERAIELYKESFQENYTAGGIGRHS